jgi:hypothetical protein
VHLGRPHPKELTKKLRRASELLASRSFVPVDLSKLVLDFNELDLFLAEEQHEAVAYALQEVQPKNYQGKSPPERSFEQCIVGQELFVFVWDSSFFAKRMYLKFCIPKASTTEEELLWLLSLHSDRPASRKKTK